MLPDILFRTKAAESVIYRVLPQAVLSKRWTTSKVMTPSLRQPYPVTGPSATTKLGALASILNISEGPSQLQSSF